MTPSLKLVLDTNVALDLMVFSDPGIVELQPMLSAQQVVLYAHERTLAEFARVLAYPRLQLAPESVLQIHARYAALCMRHPVSESLSHLPQCRDRDDQIFIELAAAVSAHVLLSKDKDVLRLGRQRYQARLGFEIATPDQWLARFKA